MLEVALGRRRFMTYLLGVPALAVATRITFDAVAPDAAAAALPSAPSVEEMFDIGEALVVASAPTMPLVKLEIGEDGVARMGVPRIEMGQGITTALGMLIAEELDLRMDQVEVTCADARPELVLNQMTAGSSTIRAFYDPVRVLAATARARMLAAAAVEWGLPVGSLTTSGGSVTSDDGRTATFGELAPGGGPRAAGRRGRPQGRVRPQDRRHAGPACRRVGHRDRAQALHDGPPGARRAPDDDPPGPHLERHVPVAGQPRCDRGDARGPRGRHDPLGVAVVAETFEQARAAVCAVDATFSAGPVPNESNDSIMQKLKKAALPFAAPALGAVTVEASYEWPSASHAFLETECAIADVRPGGAEIWSGFQAPIVAQQKIAVELGLPQKAVKAHVVPCGGGFGRRVFFDTAMEAALISKAVGKPIKLMWHRTDDMRHGRCRPANVQNFRATLVAGQVATLEQRVCGVSTDYRHGLGEILTATATALPEGAKQAVANDAFGQAVFLTFVASPYNFGVYDKRQTELSLGIPTSSYRSVPNQTARGSEEMFVDEIAERLGVDPVEFRRSTLKSERTRAVLDAVVDAGDWGRRMPTGFAQGIGVHVESRSHTAALIELDCRDPKNPRVTKAVMAVDVGKVINPLGLEAQMQGGLAEAISLTLKAGLHVVDGLPLEGSYSQYHFARQKDFPPIWRSSSCRPTTVRSAVRARSAVPRRPVPSRTPTPARPACARVRSRSTTRSTSIRSRPASSPAGLPRRVIRCPSTDSLSTATPSPSTPPRISRCCGPSGTSSG
ncbi:molybdopterin cofactor-binding domain-containing protein [Pseudonocardia benzenivorans]